MLRTIYADAKDLILTLKELMRSGRRGSASSEEEL